LAHVLQPKIEELHNGHEVAFAWYEPALQDVHSTFPLTYEHVPQFATISEHFKHLLLYEKNPV
jgi:hypothetical protein